ncbi:MAG: hypothetical protein WBA74_09545 [Cyclobacteriaceae bacterium]
MKFFLIILFSVISVFSLSAQNGRIELHPGDSIGTYKLLYMSDIESAVTISMLDDDGNKVTEHTVEDKKGFAFPIDMNAYKGGKYYIEVFTPFYTLYESFIYETEIELLKEYFEGEVIGQKVIITGKNVPIGEYRIVINENYADIISDEKVNGPDFGMRVFDFNDSEADVTNVSVYYNGNKIESWSVKKEVDP